MLFMPKDIEQYNDNNCLAKHQFSPLLILNFRKEKTKTKDIREFLSKKKNTPKFHCFAHNRKAKAKKNLVREKQDK